MTDRKLRADRGRGQDPSAGRGMSRRPAAGSARGRAGGGGGRARRGRRARGQPHADVRGISRDHVNGARLGVEARMADPQPVGTFLDGVPRAAAGVRRERGHQRVLEREHFQGGVGNRLFRARVHRGRDHVAARRNHGRGDPEIGVGEPADGQEARQEAHDRLHVGQGGMLEPGGDAVGNRPGRARRCPGRRGDGRRGRLLGHLGLGNRLGHCSQSNRSRGEGTTECPRAGRGEVLGYEARAGGGTRMRTECYHLPAPAPSTRAGSRGEHPRSTRGEPA